jgi:undecaprenyl-diphosphatase
MRVSDRETSLNLGLLLMLSVILLGFVVAYGVTAGIDHSVLLSFALRNGSSSDALIILTQWVSWVGNLARLSWLTIGIAAWIAWDRRYSAALTMLVIPPIAGATCSMLKEAFARARPNLVPALDQVIDLSFPSGHAAGAMAVFLTAALLIPVARPRIAMAAALACAGAVGISRVFLGVHFPTDVLGGWLWGAGVALVGVALAHRYGMRRP